MALRHKGSEDDNGTTETEKLQRGRRTERRRRCHGLQIRTLEDGRRLAGQHGRRRVQARRPRPDLPQVHLRRLRGGLRPAGEGDRRRRGPRRPRRIPCSEYLLGPARGAMAEAAVAGASAHHRAGRGRRNERHRAGQPCPQGRPAQGLRAPGARQDPPGAGRRPREQHQARRGRCPRHRCARQRLRILPGAVRPGRGSQGRRVLHPAQRRAPPRRDAGTFQGRVYDPCCGSSGMFVQSVEFIRAHASGNGNGGRQGGISPSTARSRTTRRGGWRG